MARCAGRPLDAVEAAVDGRAQLKHGSRLPDLEARLHALEARAQAVLGATDECARALAQAEDCMAQAPATIRSQWISHFDEASLANEAACCLRKVGRLTEARRQAERVVVLRTLERARSRAFGQLVLAEVLTEQGDIDEACAVGREVVGATRALGSFRVVQQLEDLRKLLNRHRRDRVVGDFISLVHEASQERAWLQQWSRGAGRIEESIERA